MAKALIIFISNLLPEFLANAKVILALLKPAGTVAAFSGKPLLYELYCLFIGIESYFHTVSLSAAV